MKAFAQDLQREITKINWPSRGTVFSYTVTVLIVSVVVGYILGAFDSLFTAGLKYLLSSPL
ncbi:MAG TPA: preprotein translocase subunit SecE [Candidatus Paceibacterota bacterium]